MLDLSIKREPACNTKCVCFDVYLRPGELHRWVCRRSAAASGGLWCDSNLGGSRTSPPQQSGLALWSAPLGLHNLTNTQKHTHTLVKKEEERV